jgi:biofilm PGA synthesis protein PgaA
MHPFAPAFREPEPAPPPSRRRFRPCRLVLVLALIGFPGGTEALAQASAPGSALRSEADTTVQRLREDAVLMARAGRLEEARDRLLHLRHQHPGDLRVLGDLLVVLGWMGDDERIIAEAGGAPVHEVAPYALEALARARRNRRDPEGAAALYRIVLEGDPSRRESRLGLALSLREAGRAPEGLEVIRPLLGPEERDPDVAVAAGHILLAVGEPLEAATWYRRALLDGRDDPEAWRGRALALAALGASHLAAEQVAARPTAFTPAERELIQGDRAASLVRWGELPPEDPSRPHLRTDQALQHLDGRIDAIPSDLSFHRTRARFDRMVALSAREQHEAVVAEWESLRAEGAGFPPYVLKVTGDALLHLRRPEESTEVLRASLRARPEDVETRLLLFYALVESEDLDAALEEVDALVASQPEWRWAPGLREPRENPDRVRGEVAALMGRAFAGRHREAQAGLERMVDLAPMNAGLRAELASVYRFRGWPGRALEQAELAIAADPAAPAPRIARAGALLERRQWREAEAAIADLRTRHPGNSHVRRLAMQHDVERAWTFGVETDAGRSTGTALGAEDLAASFLLRSPISDAGLRAFLRGWRSQALFDPGRALTERVEGGLRVDGRRGWLSLAGSREVGSGGRPGVGGEVGVRGGDRLDLSVSGESRSSRIPLQARLAEIDGWSAAVTGRIRWHEGRTALAEFTRMELDDGNRRHSVYALLEQRLATTPRVRLSGTLEAYGSSNSGEGAPYFNPARDLSPSLGLVAEWITWRRWERSFEQRLTVSGGGYWQESFDPEPTGLVRYEHVWRASPGLGFRYGVTFWRRAFDGQREDRNSLSASIDWRIP